MLKKESIHFINKNRSLIVCEDNFVYLLPCIQLRNWISNFTISFPNQTIISDNYTIIPHGSVTLVFFYDATGLHSLLFGPTTKPKTVGNIANRCDVILIIEFQPAGFFPLIGIQQSELIDKVVPFSIINTSLDLEIKKIFNESLSIDKLILKLEELLISNIKIEYSYEFILAIQLIIQNSGNSPYCQSRCLRHVLECCHMCISFVALYCMITVFMISGDPAYSLCFIVQFYSITRKCNMSTNNYVVFSVPKMNF